MTEDREHIIEGTIVCKMPGAGFDALARTKADLLKRMAEFTEAKDGLLRRDRLYHYGPEVFVVDFMIPAYKGDMTASDFELELRDSVPGVRAVFDVTERDVPRGMIARYRTSLADQDLG